MKRPTSRDVAVDGLGRSVRPTSVLVLGAGMAGLAAALELRRAGHEVTVLEARTRVGGRVHTLRDPFSHGQYGEAGAMRIPRAHDLTLAYVARFGLATVPFTSWNPQGFAHLAGTTYRLAEVESHAGALGFDVPPGAESVSARWEAEVNAFASRIAQEGPEAWNGIVREHDGSSTREFLEARGWPEGAIELWGLLYQQEALLNSSFLELLREEVGGYYRDMVAIEGGMDRLPAAFLPELAGCIRFGAEVVAINQSPDSVTVHYRTAGVRTAVSADYAIVTLPFPVLRHVELLRPLSRPKHRAIRQLHYDASAKILMQFRGRFWEERDGIFGGGSFTDLPIRAVYYPEHGRESGRGVLLASYTWSEDAQRWGSLSPRGRQEQALENLAVIHPDAPGAYEGGTSVMWHDDRFAGGAFALFDPGQQTLLHDAITAPEGRLYFAGEHASLAHAWIQGAIDAGLHAAAEIHARTAISP